MFKKILNAKRSVNNFLTASFRDFMRGMGNWKRANFTNEAIKKMLVIEFRSMKV